MSWCDDEAARAVDAWERRWRQGEQGPWYLYYARGSLCIVSDCMEAMPGYELGDNEQVPSNRERAGVVAWVVERARRLPCLPEEPPR